MKTLILVLAFATVVRAEIQLELLAEFQLPMNAEVWDVQHWMDGSTIGWAAVVGGTIYYETRRGEGVQTNHYLENLCAAWTENDEWDREWYVYWVHAITIVKGQTEIPRFACVADFRSSEGDWRKHCVYWRGTTDLVFYTLPGYCPTWWGEAYQFVWPPPPAPSTKVILSFYLSTYCEAMGPDHFGYSGTTLFFSVVDNSVGPVLPVSQQIRHFPGRGYEFGTSGRHSYWFQDDGPPYWVTNTSVIRTITGQTVLSDTVCHEFYHEDGEFGNVPHLCLPPSSLVAAVDRQGHRLMIVNGRQVYDGGTHELLRTDSLPTPLFVVQRMAHEGQILVHQSGDRLAARDLDTGELFDYSQQFEGTIMRVLEVNGSPSEFVTEQIQDNMRSIRVYKLHDHKTDLTISVAAIGGEVLLSWNSIPLATGYFVCRARSYDADICDDDRIWTTDTTLTLTPAHGANKEFFRVEPVFE